MSIEVCTIGGFTKTEGNSVAIKVDDEVVLIDMGLSMENYIRYSEDREDVSAKTYAQLRRVDAVPNYKFIEDWKSKVKVIVSSHGHLDHIGAIPFCAHLFGKAPIVSTPYTIEILKTILRDERIRVPNRLVSVNLNSKYKVSENITIEFVAMTHSIINAAVIVIHTPYGKVLYVNDFKLDRQPTLGLKPNLKRLEQIGNEGDVKLLIMNCLYVHENRKMPSESVAKQMLKDVMLGVNSKGAGMIVTTFSSHMARLKSIIEMGERLNRKIVFLGRSIDKYVKAAEKAGLVNFSKKYPIIRFRDKINAKLAAIMKEGKEKYLIVCTGHQGEPRAILSRLTQRNSPYKFDAGDIIVFSCSTIPVELNIQNRERLEAKLRSFNTRIFTNVHVSGHGAREDHRDMLELIRPENLIPAHAEPAKSEMLKELADQLKIAKTHIMLDGKRITL